MTINGISTCTLDECRAARDKWLTAKEEKEDRR